MILCGVLLLHSSRNAYGNIPFHRSISAFSSTTYIQVRSPFFSRLLLPHLGGGGTPNSIPCLLLLDPFQSKAIHLVKNLNLTKSLKSFSSSSFSCRSFIFCDAFAKIVLRKLGVFAVPVRRVRATKSSTLSPTSQISPSCPRTLSHKSLFITRIYSVWGYLLFHFFFESYSLSFFKSKIENP